MAPVLWRGLLGQLRSKYQNKPTYVDGVYFQSRREAGRWAELKILERAGAIRDLRRQVRYPLHAPGLNGHAQRVGFYVADFVYVFVEVTPLGGKRCPVVEDAKGFQTDLYRWKKTHFALEYGFPIREV